MSMALVIFAWVACAFDIVAVCWVIMDASRSYRSVKKARARGKFHDGQEIMFFSRYPAPAWRSGVIQDDRPNSSVVWVVPDDAIVLRGLNSSRLVCDHDVRTLEEHAKLMLAQ